MMNLPTFTVLMVEDFAADRDLYRRALRQDSSCVYELLEVESVAAGLALCQTRAIDAILLDYALPDGNGLDFISELSVQSNGRMPPVIMMTGQGNESIAVRAIKLGAEDYVVKGDLPPDLLQLKVQRAIESSRRRQQQQQVELSLQAANQQIKTIWESMTDAYMTLDPDWRIVYANSAADRIFYQLVGLTPAEFLGKSHWEVFPWMLGTIVEQNYRRAVTDRVAVDFELFYEPTETWFEIHAYPSDVGLGLYFQDINERKRTELARIQAEREIDGFFDVSLDLLGVVNLDRYFARINPACEQILGFTSAEIMAQPFIDFLHPDDIAATMAVFESLSAGNALVNFENRYRCKDGSYRWILWSAMLEPERQLIYANGRDITERKRDEELLRQSEELTRRILESSRDCIKVVDLAGRLIYMNDPGQSLMEIDDFSTVANSQWLEFWQDSERELAQAALSTALAGGVDRFDGYCATAKGTPKWWEVIVTPILAADGEVSQILSVSRDITERKIDQLNDRFLYELTQRLRHITDPEAIQWEAVKSFGEYLNVDRSLWYEVGEGRMAMVLRDWDRDGVSSIVGEYPLDEFLSPTFQAAMYAGKPTAISDVTTDPLTADYSDNYQQVGIKAFANIPCLDDEGRWVMTLHLNTAQNVRIWREDEIQLMQTLVTQLWSFVAEARAMQALRAQEQQTRAAQAIIGQQLGEIESIYQMAPVGLCFVDTDFRYVRINEQLAQINGLSVAEHIGKTFEEVLPELVDTIEPMYRQVMESGEPIIDLEVTGTNRAHPGVERWWLASFYPQTDDRGRVVGVNNVVQEISLRKRLEAARLAAEQERDRFFDRSIDLLSIGNFEGYFVRINPAFERLLGFSETEFISRPFIDFVHPDDRQSTLAAAHSLANGQSVVDFENRCQCKDGSIVWVSWNATPYQQSNCWYGVGRDITERKQLEAQLRQRESQLQLFVKYVPVGLAMFDRDMCYLSASDVWIDSHELGDRDFVGRSHYDLYPDLPQQWKEMHQRCLAGAIESCEEDLFPRPDGSIDWVRWEVRPWYTDTDEIGGIIIFSETITERKRQSAALLQSERKFSAIFNQTFQLMGLVSLDGVLLEANHAALKSVAAPESEIVGKSFWEAPWWHTEQLQQQLREAIATAAGGRFVRYEVEFPNFNGGLTITDFSLKPMFDEVGRVESIVAEAHDITDRKQAQADLEERNQELDSFVFVVSHDLKAPLRAVANLSQWIEDDLEGQLSNDTQSQMNLLRSRVNRMSATIDGLLEYARCGRSEDPIETVAVARLLADVIDSVAPPATFTIDLPAELPTFSTKRTPLFQVLVNLIGNGIKHHHSEAGKIQIAIAERGDFYEFAIADDGSGIAPEHHDRMFKIFQAVNPQKRSDSTGIGLAIVKKIIEAEGGTIRLESELGRGTTFYFTWPKRSGQRLEGRE
jgi:PAS domain S-box-containing protein